MYNPKANARFFRGSTWIRSEDVRRIPWGQEEDYEASEGLGSGSYSTVYAGINVRQNKPVVLKLLDEIKDYRIFREIDVLNQLREHPNIVTLEDATKNAESGIATLIYNYVNHTKFSKVQEELTLQDLKRYTYQLLDALRFANEHGVMHRDIKPHNLLFNHAEKDVKIIDWGLAGWYDELKQHSPSVATTDYRSPEISLDFTYYDMSVDMWSLGCVFGEMMFRLEDSMFEGEDEEENLNEAAKYLGSDGLYWMARKYWLGMNPTWVKYIGYKEKAGFSGLISDKNRDLVTPEGLDLLEKMLTWDFADRISVADAMNHPFFDSLRGEGAQKSDEAPSDNERRDEGEVQDASHWDAKGHEEHVDDGAHEEQHDNDVIDKAGLEDMIADRGIDKRAKEEVVMRDQQVEEGKAGKITVGDVNAKVI